MLLLVSCKVEITEGFYRGLKRGFRMGPKESLTGD